MRRLSYKLQGGDDDVDQLDPGEGQQDAAEAINQEIALQDGERANGLVGHAAQRQRD